MKIALRTSGGRGEYELAGRQGAISARDIFNLDMSFELKPGIIVSGHAHIDVTPEQGKPRIRLTEKGAKHAYSVLAAALLLPKPIRELGKTPGGKHILAGEYSITDIPVDVVRIETGKVVLRPTQLVAGNSSGWRVALEFPQRMALITAAWIATPSSETELVKLLATHHKSILSGTHQEIIASANTIYTYLGTKEDALPILLGRLGVGADAILPDVVLQPISPGPVAEDEDVSPLEASRRLVRKWRLQVARGASAAKFSREVKKSYDYRCAFTGMRLPKIDRGSPTGVEAAHILPWAEYDLDTVHNGICLNGLCHWAFDAGLLRLDYDTPTKLILSIPETVREMAISNRMDIAYFESIIGKIPSANFPKDPAYWPKRKYLEEINSKMFEG